MALAVGAGVFKKPVNIVEGAILDGEIAERRAHSEAAIAHGLERQMREMQVIGAPAKAKPLGASLIAAARAAQDRLHRRSRRAVHAADAHRQAGGAACVNVEAIAGLIRAAIGGQKNLAAGLDLAHQPLDVAQARGRAPG